MKPHKPKFAGARGNVVPLRRETFVRYETRDPAPMRALHGWSAHASFDAAMALAVCREKPGDWTPEILQWRFAGYDRHVEMIMLRLSNLVLLKGARAGVHLNQHRIKAIVIDAMNYVRDRVSVASNTRSKQIVMRKGDYLALRNAAEKSLLSAIDQGLTRYFAAWNGQGRQLRAHPTQKEHFNDARRAA